MKDSKVKYLIALGASAGGLEALQLFFSNMPLNSRLAFVVIQHLSPDYKSLMVELLSRQTKMKVMRVVDGAKVEPDCVYIIPPKKTMIIKEDSLFLIDQRRSHGLNLPIDEFFRSLATSFAEKAVGIILSGTGSDGTMGIRAIKEEGGLVIVQDEVSARFDGMPRSAMSTGLADFILPPQEMPDQIMRFINHPVIAKKNPDELQDDGDYMGQILRLLRKKTRVDFMQYKPNTVLRRIERRMGIVQTENIEHYWQFIDKNENELKLLYNDLLIGVTKFFRDKEAFNQLKQVYIPQIFENALKRNDDMIRIWNVACSTGEEAFSLAILFHDHMRKNNLSFDIKIFATDIDHESLKFAGNSIYPESIVADVDIEYLSRYFEKIDAGYRISRTIRQSILFAYQNIISDPPFTKVDLITCRNLLIYIKTSMQKKILSIFNYALLPDGYMFLGGSESIGEMEKEFVSVDSKWRIYKHCGIGKMPIRTSLSISGNGIATIPEIMLHNKAVKPTHRFDTHKLYYETIIKKLAPTLLIVNDQRKLVNSIGNVNQFLEIPEGDATHDISQMLPRELSLAVTSAFHKIVKDQRHVVYPNIRVKTKDKTRVITMKVDVFHNPRNYQNFFMILFAEQESEEKPVEDIKTEDSKEFVNQRINDLEQELQFTKENLQATIEELQTSNEELQATNEELMASNEELQSTNEELQSVNEELNTVNNEYQEKVSELTDLNNDINNLIKSTNIGIIFLDTDFCIRRFSLDSLEEIDLRPQDIGRPIYTFSIPMMENMSETMKQVIATGKAVQKNIFTKANNWFLLRIQTYKNENKITKGLVLTFTDINEIKVFEELLIKSEELRRSLMENTPCLIYMQDIDGRYIEINKAMKDALQLPRNQIIGKMPETIFSDDIVAQEKEFRDTLLSTKQSIIIQEYFQKPYFSIKYLIMDEEEKIKAIGTISIPDNRKNKNND
ncbi:signal transduction histidine kinase with CheB and CheR activity [Candidatus Magnetomorum sp. HK-1]|nr:signal transduction histidine kinase with CheB and CheR activity [Candidatus Magnetomorum sp. HK-1]